MRSYKITQVVKKQILKLIEYYLLNNRSEFKKTDFLYANQLLKLNVLEDLNERKTHVEINLRSFLLGEVLLEVVESKLKRKLPNDVLAAFQFIDEYHHGIRVELGQPNNILAFNTIKHCIKPYILILLKEKHSVDLESFLKKLTLVSSQERDSSLNQFEKFFLWALPFLKMEVEKVFELILFLDKNIHGHHIISFCRDLGKTNPTLANELYNYGIDNDILKFGSLAPNILIGLYNNKGKATFDKAIKLIGISELHGYWAISRFDIQTKKELSVILSLLKNLRIDDEKTVFEQSYCISRIINNPLISEKQLKDCWKSIADFLRCKNEKIIASTIEDIISIKGFENEKYEMLIIYLHETQNFRILDSFFSDFDDPIYLFHLISITIAPNRRRGDIKPFELSVRHFWGKNQNETEKLILTLFTGEMKHAFLAIDILMCGYYNPLPINLLKLKKESHQITAIESICNYPISFDKLVPILLKLVNSRFKFVVKSLQENLIKLIFKAYGKRTLEFIKNNHEVVKKTEFLAPIIKGLEEYEEVIKQKKSINDINPYENERSLVNLYYKLEAEENSKAMEKAYKNDPFTALSKNVAIVRGNGWKLDGKDEVSGFNKFESVLTVDMRMYKNPDWYELKLREVWT